MNIAEVTINNIEFDTSCPQEKFDKLKSNTLNYKSRNGVAKNETRLRRSIEVNNYTAQLPRSTLISGVNTSRTVYISPKQSKNSPNIVFRGSTESTKAPYLLGAENILSTAKPPKLRRETAIGRSPRETMKLKSRNYLQGK